ncbi:MAG: twin-arginine translocase TatA/TatE family subunit [Trueperaceae bacterium]|nr:twin-arginine translocase TatA/TatE family subunit [Trueperaceae bacterium]MCC6310865.1 twin-arginine translocase TatA/TatE family subunit [Trueperaceae bacterium]MCO5173989.1 twin-arginine translocase TatA/TatE family subunit [Trueperaceae bacterium]MCW5819199.1 twin-arginine translocase TatA/TatE family subunit [Trueperaceae bacterium]
MGRIGPIGIPELLIILALVLLIFGPKRLPEMAKGLGQSVREFRKGLRDMKKDLDDESDDGRTPGGAATPVAAASAGAPSANVSKAAGSEDAK